MSSHLEIRDLPSEIVVDEKLRILEYSNAIADELIKVILKNKVFLSQWMIWARAGDLEQQSKIYIQNAIKAKKNNEFANHVVIYNEKICGGIGLHKRDSTGKYLEFGYWLAEDFQGNGIITKSLKKFAEIIFNSTSYEGLDIGCDSENFKSQAIPKRLGYKIVFDGCREIGEENPHTCDGPLFRLTREAWKTGK